MSGSGFTYRRRRRQQQQKELINEHDGENGKQIGLEISWDF